MGIRRFHTLLVLLVTGLLLINLPGIMANGLVNLGAIRAAKGYPLESVTHMLRAVTLAFPDNTQSRRLMGYLLYRERDYIGVVHALSGACTTQRSDILSMLRLGLSYCKFGCEAEAVRCFSLGGCVPYLIRLGDQAAHGEAAADAEKWYILAAQADPRSELAALALAHLYDHSQRTDEARRWYLRALELSPNNAQTYVELAILVFRQLHDRTQAEQYLHHAIEIEPGQINAYMWLGHIAYARGERATAAGWYRRAMEIDPSSAWARWYLGRTLCEMGEHDAGIRVLEEALSRDTRDAVAYHELGRCYLSKGSLDRAAEAFVAAIRFETRDDYLARAYEGLGDVYVTQGRLSEAVCQYQRALVLDPANKNAARKLDNLRGKVCE